MKNHICKSTLLVIIMMALFVRNSAGQEITGNQKLEDMSLRELLNIKIVTASKSSQSAQQAAATVIVVTAEQIKIRGYRSLLDVMFDLPEYKVDDKMRSLIRNQITVRGVPGQEKFSILMDGVRISSPTNDPLPVMENYPVHLAEQIEIVYGPASALYGADAVSGIINIITKKTSKGDLAADVSSEVGIYGLTNSTLFISKKISEEAQFVLSGQFFYDQTPDYSKLYKDEALWDFSSHKTGTFNSAFGPMTPAAPVNSKYEAPISAYNVYAALHIKGFVLAYLRHSSQMSSAIENNPNNAVYNKDVFIKQTISTARASYNAQFGKITSVSTLSQSQYVLDPKSNFRNLYTGMEIGYKYAFGSSMKVEEQIEWKASKKIGLIGGISIENFNVTPKSTDLQYPVSEKQALSGIMLNSKTSFNPAGISAPFHYIKYNNAGGYLQLNYSPDEKISFTVGSRYDYNSRYGKTFNPRAGIVFHATEKTIIKAMYGSAFIAPSPMEAYEFYGSFNAVDSSQSYSADFWHLPNPGLKPIKEQTSELSVNQMLSEHFNISVNGYYTKLSNLFSNASDADHGNIYGGKFMGYPVGYIEVKINQDKESIWGGCFKINYSDKTNKVKWDVFASVSYVDGRLATGNSSGVTGLKMDLEYASRWITKAGVDMKVGKLSCSPRLILMAPQHIAGLGDTSGHVIDRQHISGYALLNLSARYQFSKSFNIFTNVHNVLNQKYKMVGFGMDLKNPSTELFYGANQDPIRISGGINLTF